VAVAAAAAVATAATAVLPRRAAVVAIKTPAAKAMAGAQTTINNQLKAAAATATGQIDQISTGLDKFALKK
jgi:hypothetical protein